MIRILIVEDHEMVRDAIASLLGEVPDMEVVATACNIRDALRLLDKHRPDVVLADLALDDGSGTELVRALGRGRSRRRLLILTGLRDAFAARDALARGAAGYMLKSQRPSDLLQAIRTVAVGNTYIAPEIVTKLATQHSAAAGQASDSPAGLAALSHREHEIFRQIVAGYGSKDISQRLSVSLKTVETHRTSINRKLAVQTTADLIRCALAHGVTVGPRVSSDEVHSELTARDRPQAG
jgi:DNA-binding NarL/FixJ family response regulator